MRIFLENPIPWTGIIRFFKTPHECEIGKDPLPQENHRILWPMKKLTEGISDRKADHIDLAFASQAGISSHDTRFYYEPLSSAHPEASASIPTQFLGKTLQYPIWVSSMTGGTQAARQINENLARLCGEFGFGMGLGSCRALLDQPQLLPDFDVRQWIGNAQPLFANLGIAQIEKMVREKTLPRIAELLDTLRADGLIVHLNPLQEWLQPEGDRIDVPPLETLNALLEEVGYPVIVKEVGQGMGPESLMSLLSLPIAAVEFAAYGGTNFSILELSREEDEMKRESYAALGSVGHTAEEMVSYVNNVCDQLGTAVQCPQVIISGGVRNFLDGFYLMKKLNLPAIYGQASGFLKHAQHGYDQLQTYARIQTDGLKLAFTYLRVR